MIWQVRVQVLSSAEARALRRVRQQLPERTHLIASARRLGEQHLEAKKKAIALLKAAKKVKKRLGIKNWKFFAKNSKAVDEVIKVIDIATTTLVVPPLLIANILMTGAFSYKNYRSSVQHADDLWELVSDYKDDRDVSEDLWEYVRYAWMQKENKAKNMVIKGIPIASFYAAYKSRRTSKTRKDNRERAAKSMHGYARGEKATAKSKDQTLALAAIAAVFKEQGDADSGGS